MELRFPAEAEDLFSETPPDYDSERSSCLIKLVLVFCLWSLIIPSFLAKEVSNDAADVDDDDQGRREGNDVDVAAKTTVATKNDTNDHKHKKKNRKDGGKPEKNLNRQEQEQRQPVATTHKVIDTCTNIYCIVGLILHVLYLLLKSSPDNYYTTRSVFETPLFTDDECRYVVDMAERAAQVNYETASLNISKKVNDADDDATSTSDMKNVEHLLLKEPYGWQKKRHQSHPTTDLNLVVDPFSQEDREWIQHKLDARLAPTLERIFGVPPASIRANDIFIIRYDGDRQASLEKHTDSGTITFSALLSDGFEGGGTRYYNRFKQTNNPVKFELDGDPFAYVLPEKGMMQTFPGIIQHEGVQTEKGRRYLLIGFLNVDRVDPWTGRPTGLSWLASWASINWATTKVKVGWKELAQQSPSSSSHQLREIFLKLQECLITVGEMVYEHRFVKLVDKTSSKEYLDAMDKSYDEQTRKRGSVPSRGSWFSGQQIDVGFDGMIRRRNR